MCRIDLSKLRFAADLIAAYSQMCQCCHPCLVQGLCPPRTCTCNGSQQALASSAASRLLSLKGVLKQPLAKMCHRSTDWASSSTTVARQARTHDQILEWVDFVPAALSRLKELDDETHVFSPQVRRGFA